MMTDNEIRSSYKYAADQKAQIEILSQLNACDPNDIRQILGLPLEGAEKPYRRGEKHQWTPTEDKVIRLMVKQRKTDAEIAAVLNVSVCALTHRRKIKLGLYHEGRKKK